jgi:hypothetical protein
MTCHALLDLVGRRVDASEVCRVGAPRHPLNQGRRAVEPRERGQTVRSWLEHRDGYICSVNLGLTRPELSGDVLIRIDVTSAHFSVTTVRTGHAGRKKRNVNKGTGSATTLQLT